METAMAQEVNNLEIWIPAIVSIITLVVNLLFYIFIQPRMSYRASAKERLTKISVEMLNYLADIISYENFEGVPTQIRKYSLQIHLHFKSGVAKIQLEQLLELIFQECKKRKELVQEDEIVKWEIEFRDSVRKLRKELARYCGDL